LWRYKLLKIAVLGAGAMGSLFGAYLSEKNDVVLIETDREKVRLINSDGITVKEHEGEKTIRIKALLPEEAASFRIADLLIVFVKAMYENEALEGVRTLIGSDTYLLTLQNGEGHEEVLKRFTLPERVIIGTTQHNSSVIKPGHIYHGGGGETFIGPIAGQPNRLKFISDNFISCGIKTTVSDNVKELIWKKLFLNASASVLTGILQVRLGYIVENEAAWSLAQELIREAVETANLDGMSFDVNKVTQEISEQLKRSRSGYTSIYADLKSGNKTEVDTISGAVLKAAERLGAAVPMTRFAISLVHAMEGRGENG